MLVCDPLLEANGTAMNVRDASGGRVAARWTEVESDAPLDTVVRGADTARDFECDGIVALGGGSAIDSAKAIALLPKGEEDLVSWDGANKVGEPGLPLVAIPTTAGTGSEASC